jgi:hypothetical protein
MARLWGEEYEPWGVEFKILAFMLVYPFLKLHTYSPMKMEQSVPKRWHLTFSNQIFLAPAYSPALISFGWKRGWWVTCNYPTVLKEKNINRNIKSTTSAICWLTSVLHEQKRRELENHNFGLVRHYEFPVLGY